MKLDLKSSPRHIKRLQNIAKVISGLGDVRVVIDDNTKGPYFDPVNKVCVLPNGDYSDDDFVSLIEGFTCHEAGHGRYTDSEVYSDAFNSVLKSFIEWYLLNSLRVKVLQQAGHKETLDPFFDYAQKILSPVISDVEEIFHDALGCENTQGCESLARKTLALLERLRDEAREQQQQTEQEEQEAYDESETETDTDTDTESEDKSL
ncbi:hypothetical protein GWQ42_10270, partial [Salmonella enterica subsp. enterica serovar Panama]|nr:hypothetical protein [Salmonella enterica subsp. enterica serovar Panama]